MILDGHNDVLKQLWAGVPGTFATGLPGHLDAAKARAGGLGGGFFACYVPSPGGMGDPVGDGHAWEIPYAEPVESDYALGVTLAMIARLRESADAVTLVRTVPELEAALAGDTVAAILHVEGAEAVDPDLDRLGLLYELGLRSIGPVWSRANAFGIGVPFRYPSSPDVGPGLTDAGKRLVDRCGELGVMVDLAHLNERGFWDVAERATAPLVATHTAAHALTPTARNVTDAQIDAIGASGGVIGINLSCWDLREDAADDPDVPLSRWAEHAEHVAARIGAQSVAIGSDFDGATIPRAIGDASGTSRLLDALRERGWTAEQLDGVASGNYLRVLRSTWRQ